MTSLVELHLTTLYTTWRNILHDAIDYCLFDSTLLAPWNSSFNSPTDGTAEDGAPVSTVSQSEHVIPSDVTSAVNTPTVPMEGEPGADIWKDARGSTFGRGNAQRGNVPILNIYALPLGRPVLDRIPSLPGHN